MALIKDPMDKSKWIEIELAGGNLDGWRTWVPPYVMEFQKASGKGWGYYRYERSSEVTRDGLILFKYNGEIRPTT